MKKLTLILRQTLPISCAPRFVELEPERICTNDVIFPGESNPHNVRLWVIGNEYGALGAVWAEHEKDALDELVDRGLGQGLLVGECSEEEAEKEGYAHLGNAGELADLTNAWLAPVDFSMSEHNTDTLKLMLLLAEARGANVDNLGEL